MEFFKFPHTPHIAWLGSVHPRADKVLSTAEANAFLADPILVEEKVDGANIGLSLSSEGDVLVQNRGEYIREDSPGPQFKSLFRWLAPRKNDIADALSDDIMLFGEWCYAVHSVKYDRLPDWFLLFDVYDRRIDAFWSARRRDQLAIDLRLSIVPRLSEGTFTLNELPKLLEQSRFADAPAEGVYLRREDDQVLLDRAKLVRPEFVQGMSTHWSKQKLVVNRLA